jgi:hypothetical protein
MNRGHFFTRPQVKIRLQEAKFAPMAEEPLSALNVFASRVETHVKKLLNYGSMLNMNPIFGDVRNGLRKLTIFLKTNVVIIFDCINGCNLRQNRNFYQFFPQKYFKNHTIGP